MHHIEHAQCLPIKRYTDEQQKKSYIPQTHISPTLESFSYQPTTTQCHQRVKVSSGPGVKNSLSLSPALLLLARPNRILGRLVLIKLPRILWRSRGEVAQKARTICARYIPPRAHTHAELSQSALYRLPLRLCA